MVSRHTYCVYASALLAACYTATPQAGSPCDPMADNCPAGQHCVPSAGGGDVCSDEFPNDASIPTDDAPIGFDDTDGDGILDFLDNCPTIANPNQENEDFDPRGDACDECPQHADTVVADADGDGVGDACDPNPQTPGDSIVFFEGFANGIPSTWVKNGSWMAAGGTALLIASGNTVATLVIPTAGSPRQTLSARMTITSFTQTTGGSLGIVDKFDDVGNSGVHCGGGRSGTTELFALIDAGTGNFLQMVNREMKTGTTYDLALRRDGNAFDCSDARSPPVTVTVNTAISGGTNVGLRSRNASATFEWVMLVKSP